MQKPNQADLSVAHFTKRKCDALVGAAMRGFRTEMTKWETVSLEELIAVGTSLFMEITVRPAERMSNNANRMRYHLRKVLTDLIKPEPKEVVN